VISEKMGLGSVQRIAPLFVNLIDFVASVGMLAKESGAFPKRGGRGRRKQRRAEAKLPTEAGESTPSM